MTQEEEKAFADGIKAMFADGRLTGDTTGMEEYESPCMAEGFKSIRGNGKQGFIGPSGQAFVWNADWLTREWRPYEPQTEAMPLYVRRWWI